MAAAHAAGVRTESWNGTDAVVVEAGGMSATFLPAHGLLGVSLHAHDDDWLHLEGGVDRALGRQGRKTTGIPLLAPWANRLGGRRYRIAGVDVDLSGLDLGTDGNGLPIHGVMLQHPGWEVEHGTVDRATGSARVDARFDAAAHADVMAAFPFPHHLAVSLATDGECVTVTTTVTATGDRRVPVAFGWHPYLRLPVGERREWRLRTPACEHVRLDERSLPTPDRTPQAASEEPIGDRLLDDLFALGDDRHFALSHGDHRLAVDFDETYPYAQIWVPAAKPFVCIEPMTAPGNALVTGDCELLEPGAARSATFTLTPSVA